MKLMQGIIIVLLCAIGLTLAGCGGGSNTSGRRSSLRLLIKWPAQVQSGVRGLPSTTQRIVVEVKNTSAGYDVTQTATRPTDGSVSEISFTNVPVGTVTVDLAGYAATNEKVVVATASASVLPDQVTTVPMSLQSTITHLEITAVTSPINEGTTQQLFATAYDAENAVVPVAPDGIFWQALTPEIATIDQNGVVTCVAPGQATIKAVEQDSGQSAQITLTVASVHGSLVVQIPNDPVVVTVAPTSITLNAGASTTFSATVTGTANQYVAWSADGGMITPSGRYTAPAAPGTYHVIATSSADLGKTGSATITVAPIDYQFVRAFGSQGTANGQFQSPAYLALDAAGNIYVTDSTRTNVQKFSNTGTFLATWGTTGVGTGQFSYPTGIAVDASGNVYVTDRDNSNVQKFASDGTYQTQWPLLFTGNGLTPHGAAVDTTGNLYLAERGVNGTDGRVQKYSGAGVKMSQWGSQGTGDGQFTSPAGIAVDWLGNVYVVDQGNHRVQKFSRTGSYLTQWGGMGTGTGNFDTPTGIAVDALGNVYVADTNNNRVQKFTSTGSYLAQWGSAGAGTGQFNGPVGVAVDSDGNVYVTDRGNYRVQVFTPVLQLD